MNKILLFNAIILTLGFLGGSSAFAIQLPWQNNPTKAIPPTPAIMNVTTSNSTIAAGAWDEVLHLIGLRGIEIFGSNNSKTVYFNVTIANENGTNLGSGAKVYKNETSGMWYFRTLHNGTNISITQNSTGITIASAGSGESTTASNIGSSGSGVFSSLVGFDLQFKKLIGAGGNTITSNSTNVIINSTSSIKVNSITCSAGYHLFSINNSTGETTCTQDTTNPTGFTSINNFGTGDASLVGTNQTNIANIKRLVAGTGISISNGSSAVTISSTVTGGFTTVENTGIGTGWVKTNSSNKAEIKGVSSGQGITVSSGTSDNTIATNFKIDTLSTLAVDKFVSAFDNSTGDWTTKTFSVNSKTCSAGQHLFSIDNSTGDVTCTADTSGSSGFTTVENVGGGTLALVKTNQSNKAEIKTLNGGQGITVTNGTSTGTIATNFKIDTLATLAVDRFISAFDNATGDWTSKIFSVNSRTAQPDFFVTGIDNSTGDVAIKQFSVNNSTCVGQFVQQINNVTGQVVCASAPTSGGSGFTTIENTGIGLGLVKTNASNKAEIKGLENGTGIRIKSNTSTLIISGIGGPESMMMNMSKRYGVFTPNSATALGEGILGTTATLDGTETFEYNTTQGVLSIRSATGAVAGNNAGLSQVTANFNLFRFDQNPKLWIEAAPSANRVGLNRVFIGFQSGATQLPNNADTIVNAASAFGVCIRTTDTTYQRCENDGAGAGTYTNLGVTEDTSWHTFYIYADYDNRKWCVVLDGGTASCATSDIPAATTRLYFNAQGETSVATSTNFNYGVIRVQNDK